MPKWETTEVWPSRLGAAMGAAALLAAVFALDLTAPRGWADWLLYLVPLLIASRFLPPAHTVLFTAVCAAAMIGGFIGSPSGSVAMEVAVANCALGIAIVGAVGAALASRKRSNEILETAAREWNATFDAISDAVAVIDLDGTILRCNAAMSRLLAKSPDALPGRRCYELVHGTTEPIPGCPIVRMRETGQCESMELRLGQRWLEITVDPQRDTRGTLVGGVHIMTDITERKRAENARAALLDIAKDLAGTLDFDTLVEYVLERVATLVPCDRVITYYWDADARGYRAIRWRGIPAHLEADTAAWMFSEGLPAVERLLAGETLVINDTAHQADLPPELLAHFGLTSLVVVPLGAQGRRMGALAVTNAERRHRFDTHEVELLQGISRQAGIAMEAAELFRAQQEESAVSRALARVGQELIAALDTPALLDRLCQLTAEVLESDLSHTFLWDPREAAYMAVAGYGDRPEEWESFRAVPFSREMIAPLLATVERDGVAQVITAEGHPSSWQAVSRRYGITIGLYVGLRRGGELVGALTAGYRGRRQPFSRLQERIARGVGQIASLALDNARLLTELERANRLKSDFVSMVSHELRTPLNIIIGYDGLLLEEGFGALTAAQADVVRRIDASAETLRALIDATLDLGRLEAGQSPLSLTEIDLPSLLAAVEAEPLLHRADRPDVRLECRIPPELPRVQSDAMKLRVVLRNLIDNAFKFTSTGSVTVTASSRGDGVEIAVADTGCGMAPEVLAIIFEPFRQGESPLTRTFGGVGLGLYVVRRLLDLLGGSISVDSEPGGGSTFRVWVPLTIALAKPAAA